MVFNGINFRGAQLASDDNMLPDSQKRLCAGDHGDRPRHGAGVNQAKRLPNLPEHSAAGTIYHRRSLRRGQWRRSAGHDQRSGWLPPGLQRALRNDAGSQREGHTRFALTAGSTRSGNSQQETPDFFHGTVTHGLPAGWTLYRGTQLADRYRAFNLGVGKNMGYFGALSLDITQANATLADDSEKSGAVGAFSHNKSLNDTGTNLQLAGYRYSTRWHYNFADTTYRRMSGYSVETQDGVIQVKPKFTD